MITFLQGKLVEALPTQVVVEVNGVGYEVLIPLSSFDKLPPPGQPVKLLTQLIVREDAHMLYGFMTRGGTRFVPAAHQQRQRHRPENALNILSGMNVTAFRGAVAGGDVKSLSQISGVGKKTAERIVVELRDKIGAAGALGSRQRATRACRPTTRKSTTPCSRSWRWASNKLKRTMPSAPRKPMLGAKATVEELVRACLKKGA